MGIKSLSVILTSPGGPPVFFAGTTVHGRVIIYVEKTTHVKTLELKVKGKALVYWSEAVLDQREFIWETGRHHHRQINGKEQHKLETHHKSSQEKYFSSIVPLMVDTFLDVGTREIYFSFTLPSNIPSTFKGQYGQIRYTAVATVHTDHRFLFGGHHKSKIEFPVVLPVDLNNIPQARNGVSKFIKHNFYNIVISAGGLSMSATLKHSGFVPGQPIQISIEAENHSSIKVHGILFILKEELTWSTENNTKVTEQELARHQGDGVMCYTIYSRNYAINIPKGIHGDISTCQIISAKYFLEVEALVHGLHTNPILILEPLYIGSIPLTDGKGTPARTAVNNPVLPVQSNFPAKPLITPSFPAQAANVPGILIQSKGSSAQPGSCTSAYPAQVISSGLQIPPRPGVLPGQSQMYPNLPIPREARVHAHAAGSLPPEPPYRPPGSQEPPPPYPFSPSDTAKNVSSTFSYKR